MSSRVMRSEDIVWRRIEDEVVIVREDGMALHVLNKTAAHIWGLCDGTIGPDEIATSLCERFEVSFEEASADVRDALKKMEKEGLVRSTAEVIGK